MVETVILDIKSLMFLSQLMKGNCFVLSCFVLGAVKISVLNWSAKWNLLSTYHQRQKLENALHYTGSLVSVMHLSFIKEFQVPCVVESNCSSQGHCGGAGSIPAWWGGLVVQRCRSRGVNRWIQSLTQECPYAVDTATKGG